jgi:hypothetical protein
LALATKVTGSALVSLQAPAAAFTLKDATSLVMDAANVEGAGALTIASQYPLPSPNAYGGPVNGFNAQKNIFWGKEQEKTRRKKGAQKSATTKKGWRRKIARN